MGFKEGLVLRFSYAILAPGFCAACGMVFEAGGKKQGFAGLLTGLQGLPIPVSYAVTSGEGSFDVCVGCWVCSRVSVLSGNNIRNDKSDGQLSIEHSVSVY